ncbi:cell wall hydrolase [Methylococcus capsulatus]|jgi:N-acetylmuramoyl-L-alanine amidase|uniref:N-acetylmuramoyl-L-alanine amidase n=1 Tax=Methylococcus capsulatus TaxID=414 RepID=A0AA35V4D7_METCP|nr:cell wall hydrolase [Methylococcus capsulatus]QXP89554.1 cell wall hydrolase [Methylococcus capsulatus]CAI8818444.1 N-acetylmuramoyl-L-alanine amidase [Methylococcus capsulatus]
MNHIPARTAWAEARGEGEAGMQGVMNVIFRRAQRPGWWGRTPDEVCLNPRQFSCWNEGDPNKAKAEAVDARDRAFSIALKLESQALKGTLPDITGEATHYFDDSLLKKPPHWARAMVKTAVIGRLHFFKERD